MMGKAARDVLLILQEGKYSQPLHPVKNVVTILKPTDRLQG